MVQPGTSGLEREGPTDDALGARHVAVEVVAPSVIGAPHQRECKTGHRVDIAPIKKKRAPKELDRLVEALLR
ncbi:MAG TPA: hypothetical protein VMS87_07895, partial [Roseiarcus sp.]|nr:hypothetical protein [Roseiarcus sp.]